MGNKDLDHELFEKLGEAAVRKTFAERKFNSRRMRKAPDWLDMLARERAAEKEHREEERAARAERRELKDGHHTRRWRVIFGITAIAALLVAALQLFR